MNRNSKILAFIALVSFTFSCKGQDSNERRERRTPPSAAELIKHMDTDEDGKLSREEIKGPLKDIFEKVDLNEDGYLSLEELKKAPKPQRPNRN